MSGPPSHAYTALFLSASTSQLPDSSVLQSADAIVVPCVGASPVLKPDVASAGPPVIVIADADEEAAARLIADGAEEVLPASAGAADIARAVRHAVARRRRSPRTTAPESHLMTLSTVQTAAPSVPVGTEPSTVLGAIGRLAGGVAHDFNNLLQVIGGNAEVLQQAIPASDPRHAPARAIVDAARHAGTLTNRLLAFGRRRTMVTTSFDLGDLVSEAAGDLRGRSNQNVRIVTQLAPDLPLAWADRTQLLEVVSNLADNAFEAMSGGGTLTITTDAVEVHETMRRHRPWLAPGRYLRLQVGDTGTGLDEQAIPHLFEPFFTTKPEWNGYGLGLSSVYGTIKQSGGFIWVDSRIGEGTRVTVLLPIAPSPDHRPAAPRPEGTTARIMLVEDDDDIRGLLTAALSRHGFEVMGFAAPNDALAETRAFDMLVTDVIVPGMNGAEFARLVRARHPHVPVLFISGDAGHALDREQLASSESFLQKPFSTMTLVGRIEAMLKNAGVSDR